MILEKMTANAGCTPPLMVAHKTPTTMYGHSGLFSFKTFRKEMSGTFSYREEVKYKIQNKKTGKKVRKIITIKSNEEFQLNLDRNLKFFIKERKKFNL